MSVVVVTEPSLAPKFWFDLVALVFNELPTEQRRLLQKKGITRQFPCLLGDGNLDEQKTLISASLDMLVNALTEVFQETVFGPQYFELDVVERVTIPRSNFPDRIFMYNAAGRILHVLYLREWEDPETFQEELEQKLKELGFEFSIQLSIGMNQWKRPAKAEE